MPLPHLVLVPGLMCDATVWEPQIPLLQDLATIEIADHGMSDSLGGMAELILGRAPKRFTIAGHSMGGRVALEVIRRASARVSGVALLDTSYTPFIVGEAGEREAADRYALLEIARTQGVRAMAMKWIQQMVHPNRLSNKALIDQIVDMMARKTPGTFAAQTKALLERPDGTDVLPRIECPALVLCGREDSWSVLSRHEEMAALIPKSRLAVIETCGHMSTMERPEAVTTAMRDWLTWVTSS